MRGLGGNLSRKELGEFLKEFRKGMGREFAREDGKGIIQRSLASMLNCKLQNEKFLVLEFTFPVYVSLMLLSLKTCYLQWQYM